MNFLGRHSLALGIACSVAVVALGFWLEKSEFYSHFIALIAETILAVTVVDWWLRHQRQQEWKRVRTQIVSTLLSHLCSIAGEYSVGFLTQDEKCELLPLGEPIMRGLNIPNPDTSNALYSMVVILNGISESDRENEDPEHVHKAIKWDVEQIRSTVLPRLMAISTEEIQLISLVYELDSADREWVNEDIAERFFLGHPFKAATNFLAKVADTYAYLVSHQE